ncbi:MAG TPA: hypothetical protein VGG07_20485 [Solirubrobacteraceae bacterium]
MRDALAVYITLSLIVTVAIAQLLYWKLVIAREDDACEANTDTFDLDWLCESMQTWVGLEADEPEPVPVGDPVLVAV